MNIENEFNEQVEVPNVPTPVEVDKFTYKSGQITYAQQRFEDNSIKMWGTILEDAGRTWKTLKEINNASKKIEMAEMEQKIKSAKFEKNAVLEHITDQRRKATAVMQGQIDTWTSENLTGKDLLHYNEIQAERLGLGLGDRPHGHKVPTPDHPTYVPIDGGFTEKGGGVSSGHVVRPGVSPNNAFRSAPGDPYDWETGTEAWRYRDEEGSIEYGPNYNHLEENVGQGNPTEYLSGKYLAEPPAVFRGEYGLRPDGTPKGTGFLGEITDDDGWKMTELSVGIHPDDLGMDGGGSIDIPTLVPGLTDKQLKYLKAGGDPMKSAAIMDNAIKHARSRIEQGLPVFYEGDDPKETE